MESRNADRNGKPATYLDPKPTTTLVAVQPDTSTDLQVTEEHIVSAIQPVTQPLEETKQNSSNLKERNKFSILHSDIDRPFEEENDDDVPPQDLTTTALIENPMETMQIHSKEHVEDLNINDLGKVGNAQEERSKAMEQPTWNPHDDPQPIGDYQLSGPNEEIPVSIKGEPPSGTAKAPKKEKV
ncbi:hypothetical protein QJS10_CPB13g00859 [Acorus calamus]|uniref:Uncharacterized protein n=1 Tax=Acorus calamus TaxID=4465 RepID=A0AAV9DEJ4_ACOCL|nr:hypothetical protein QJS10_CPB13g00859 [Acorus calamus]